MKLSVVILFVLAAVITCRGNDLRKVEVVAYYSLAEGEGFLLDHSGNGFDLVVAPGDEPPVRVGGGPRDGAVYFDGNHGVLGGESLFPEGSFTVSLWLKPDEHEGSQTVIRSQGDGGYSLEIDAGGECSFYIMYEGGHRRVRPFGKLPTDDWTHLALTFEAGGLPDEAGNVMGVATLYTNGCLPRIVEDVKYNSARAGRLHLGKRGRATFRGMVADFAVFEGALNQNEIGALVTGMRTPSDVSGYLPDEIRTPAWHCQMERPRVITAPGSAYADDKRMFQGVPTVEAASNGRLWAAWYGGGFGEGEENYVMLNTSSDGGTTWSELKVVVDPPHRASEPGLWHDPEGVLWFFWNEYPNGLRGTDSRMWAITTDESHKEDPAWSEPRLVWRELNNFNKPIILSDGKWLWPTGSWNSAFPSRPILSSNGGDTFHRGGTFRSPNREFDEYSVVELRDGGLWLLNRTRKGMVETFSSDGGMSWSEPRESAIKHTNSRHFLSRLSSGNLLLVKHGDIAEEIGRSRLMAFVSTDDGRSWSEGLMLDGRPDVSYPDGVESADGTIYIIYDRGRQKEKEILLSRVTEADVLAGELVSDGSRLKMLVNKATAVNSTIFEELYNGIVLERNPRSRTNMMDYDFDPLPVPYLEEIPPVIPIDIGRQLLVDDFLIENTNLIRTFHKPQKYTGNPILFPETELERTNLNSEDIPGAVPKSGGVWWDPQDELFKMWYEAGWLGNLAYATSRDGLRWERPVLDIVPGTNAILPEVRPDSSIVWLDHDAESPDERFKLFVRPYSKEKNAFISTSPNGIHWAELIKTGGMGDRSTIFYNPFRKKWVYSLRAGRGEMGRARNYSEHSDLFEGSSFPQQVRWLRADRLDRPDPEVGDTPQLYNFDAVAYESLMIGFHQIHLGPHNREAEKTGVPKITELKLSYSRDGFHWDRPDRETFIAASRKPGDWDRAYVQSVGGICTIVGDEVWFYYIGYSGNQDPELRSRNRMYYNGATGVAKLRRDGFASMDAGEAGGELTTRPVRFLEGRYLFVNANIPEGELKVEILDERGHPVNGFTMAEAVPVVGDGTKMRVEWRSGSDLSLFQGKPLRFRFSLNGGELYSFWVSPDASGASHGYVGAGGPGFKSNIDTTGGL